MLDSNIQVKLDHFDGPMALLLHLVQKEEMNIRDLGINVITKQYLDFLGKMRKLNFDIAGDYLLMAATLLYLKSKDSLLEESEKVALDSLDGDGKIFSKEELIRRLEELARFQKLSKKLWAIPKKGHEVFVKPKINRKAIINSFLTPVELNKLIESMVDFIRKDKRKYVTHKRDRISIKEKLVQLKEQLKIGEQTTLSELITTRVGDDKESRSHFILDTVITFISILELARLNKVSIFQNESMGKIYVQVIDNLKEFDIEAADGFADEDVEDIIANDEQVGVIAEAAPLSETIH